MRDYRYHPGDSLHSITTHNRTHYTLLYPTPTNTHDIPRNNDSAQGHRTTTYNALQHLLAIARASYLLLDISNYHEHLSNNYMVHRPIDLYTIWPDRSIVIGSIDISM